MTADYDNLELIAIERGLRPYEATYCKAKGVFNVEIPEGSRFYIGSYFYTSGESLGKVEGNYSYLMTCETLGTKANGVLGTLTFQSSTDDSFDPSTIEYAELVEISIPARDKEKQEDFLQRYLESFDALAFGGNRKDYMEKVLALEGVGGCQVYSAWEGGGTVKLVIIGSDHKPASETLVNKVKEDLDPDDGLGTGICAIGHRLTVESAISKNVTVKSTITYDTGYTPEVVNPIIKEVLEAYFNSLREDWQSNYLRQPARGEQQGLIVRLAEVESRMLNVDGVIDVTNTTLNDTASNVILLTEEIPILEEVII